MKVRCEVTDCKYCNSFRKICTKDAIKVSNCDYYYDKESTMCNDYEER